MPWEDDEGQDAFRPPLPQEDRLWRHPAEVAAEQRALASPSATVVTTLRTPLRQALGLAAIGAAGGALVVAGLFLSLGTGTTSRPTTPITQSFALDPVVARPIVVDDVDWPSTVAEAAGPAVARVVVTHDTQVYDGSAVAFRSDGLLLTSRDLVVDADQVLVTLADGSRHVGDVLGTDEISGLAVVRIDEMDLPVAHLGILKPTPEVGQYTVVVTGTSQRNQPSRAAITGVGAQVEHTATSSLHGMIQLGSGLPTGGAGAAVVDDSGAVIGIALDVESENATYAVPIGFARKIAEDLLLYGDARHPWIGIRGIDLSVATQLDLGLTGGVEITSVLDGPAREAGLEPGDLLTALGDEPVDSMTDLIQMLRTKPPGETLDVEYLRDGARQTCDVTLALRPVDDGA